MFQSQSELDALSKNWIWMFAFGAIMVIGGVSAILAPLVASVVVSSIVGIIFLTGGIVLFIDVLGGSQQGARRWWNVLVAGINTAAGVLIIWQPLEGVLALTLIISLNFAVGGLARIVYGFRIRKAEGAGWMIAGGVVSLICSGILFALFPGVAAVTLGLIAGVAMLSEGAAFITVALAFKKKRA